MTKKEARDWVQKQKEQMTPDDVKEANTLITKQVLASKEYKEAKIIFTYVSMKDEPDTYEIIKDALEQGKVVGVPRCIQDHQLEVCEIKSLEDLELGFYKLMEPKKECQVLEKKFIELGIIPCVSFDLQGHRLGHGAGYYDRYMEGSTFTKMLLGYEKLRIESIPVDSYDVDMDIIIRA